jgi:glycosyltransferase involved in cell wall biosynthesis
MISVTILTRNSAETLEATLESVASFPEVILYDTGSSDETLSIGKRFSNVKIVKGEFEGFGRTHNAATASASYDFILSLDSDEVLTPEL